MRRNPRRMGSEARHNASLLDKCRPIISEPCRQLTSQRRATAVRAAIRRTIEDDRFPHAPRLDPLRAGPGKFDAALEPTPLPKAPPPAKDKRARR
jgi:hypothetical protein